MEESLTIVIPGELPDLNEFIKATNKHRIIGANLKKEADETVYYASIKHRGHAIEPPYRFAFKWVLKDKRKDYDNVAFAKKFVLDGLQQAGIIEQDSQKFVKGFSDDFEIDPKNPRCEIIIKHQE